MNKLNYIDWYYSQVSRNQPNNVWDFERTDIQYKSGCNTGKVFCWTPEQYVEPDFSDLEEY